MLPDDTLLDIFDFYRLDSMYHSPGLPWKWHRLAHVCRRWRNVIYTSPQYLDLQIFCKFGKPIQHVLGAWPSLPLVVGFNANRESESLPENVVIALRHTDRVCEIDLSVTAPISLSIADMMQVPFPALERIRIESKDAAEPVVISEFLGGSAPRLKEIHVGGIGIPFLALRRLLLSTDNLVQLRLENIPKSCYFSPDDLVTILSSLGHLKDLSIWFSLLASRSATDMKPPPPLDRSTSISLISLSFYGASEYLEAFVARTHMPALTTLTIKFFNQLIFEVPQLYGFISRVEELKFFNEVYIKPAAESIDISFYRKKHGYSHRACYLSISCRQLDWQLSFTTQIFDQLSPLLSGAELLIIYKPHSISTGREDVDSIQWLELFQPLPHLSWVCINIEELVPDVVHALVNEGMVAGVLPSLTSFYLAGYWRSTSAMNAAKRFIATCKLANRNISLSG